MKTYIEYLIENEDMHSELIKQNPRLSGSDFDHIDSYAKEHHDPKEGFNKKAVDHVIAKHRKPLKPNSTIYRGIPNRLDPKTTETKHLVAKGPLSTTIDRDTAHAYASGYAKKVKGDGTHDHVAHTLKIDTGRRASGVYVPGAHGHEDSKEFLMHSGTTLKIHPNPEVSYRTHENERYEGAHVGIATHKLKVKHYTWNAEVVHDGIKPKKGIGSH